MPTSTESQPKDKPSQFRLEFGVVNVANEQDIWHDAWFALQYVKDMANLMHLCCLGTQDWKTALSDLLMKTARRIAVVTGDYVGDGTVPVSRDSPTELLQFMYEVRDRAKATIYPWALNECEARWRWRDYLQDDTLEWPNNEVRDAFMAITTIGQYDYARRFAHEWKAP